MSRTGIAGISITVAGFILLALAGFGAAISVAMNLDGWFKTTVVVMAFTALPIGIVGPILMGHPPGSGPGWLKR